MGLSWTWTVGGGEGWTEDFEDPEAAASEHGLALLETGPSGPGTWTGVFPVGEGWAAGVWALDSCEPGVLELAVPDSANGCAGGGGSFEVDTVLVVDGEGADVWLEPEGGLVQWVEAEEGSSRQTWHLEASADCEGAESGPWLSLSVDAEDCLGQVIWAVESVSWASN